MAGSWSHTVEKDTGKLLPNVDLNGMLENGGDVYEYAEEAYGMVWWLAHELAEALSDNYGTKESAADFVEAARQNYKIGLDRSPGVADEGALEDGEPSEWAPETGDWVVASHPAFRQRVAKVIRRVHGSFDTYRIILWNFDELRLSKMPVTYHVRFLRPATAAELSEYRVPEEDR